MNPVCLNEGFKTALQVQYVARAGNFLKAGHEYHGALKVLKTILSYDYLWINVRVKGGAY
jgi:Zn-dependent M16 (insulinase) family peptidase